MGYSSSRRTPFLLSFQLKRIEEKTPNSGNLKSSDFSTVDEQVIGAIQKTLDMENPVPIQQLWELMSIGENKNPLRYKAENPNG